MISHSRGRRRLNISRGSFTTAASGVGRRFALSAAHGRAASGVPFVRAHAAGLLAAEGSKGGPASCENADATDGMETVYRSEFSKPAPGHRIYPYLLVGLHRSPNQCGRWNHLRAYARASSISPPSWTGSPPGSVAALSITMEAAFCVERWRGAGPHGNPQIFNTDQGSQFTCHSFTDVLVEHQIASAWTQGLVARITCSSSASGAVSNTRRCI